MILNKLKNCNIKCILLNSGEKYIPADDKDCYIEIIIKDGLFKEYLLSQLSGNNGIMNVNILTKREKEILKLISKGKNNEQIAKEMKVSVHTTKVQIHNIFNKLSVKDRTEAVVKAIQNNWIDISSDFNSQH